MARMTGIEWADATWNPLRGCTRISPGCMNCYAERMAARGLPGLRSPTTGEPFAVMGKAGPAWTGRVELIEPKLTEPLVKQMGSHPFLCDAKGGNPDEWPPELRVREYPVWS